MDYEFLLDLLNQSNFYNWLSMIALLLILLVIYKTTSSVNDKLGQIREFQRKTKERIKRDDFPPFYPNGWLPVLESNVLKKGQIKPILAFGNDLVAFRGVSGKATVMDAYCPHLGANLGYGGNVIGESIKCPFHGWAFNDKGICIEVPGIEDANLPKVQIKVWDSLEVNGYIFVWKHSKGEKPDWFIPNIEQIETGEFNLHGKVDLAFSVHIQDLMENFADVMHFKKVHRSLFFIKNVFNNNKIINFVPFVLSANWRVDSAPYCNHKSSTIVDAQVKPFGLTLLSLKFNVRLIGPSYLWQSIHVAFPFKCIKVHICESIISTGPLDQRMVMHIYTNCNGLLGRLIGQFVAYQNTTQVTQDAHIWNNKKHFTKPFLAKNEPSIKRFRRWYSQFY